MRFVTAFVGLVFLASAALKALDIPAFAAVISFLGVVRGTVGSDQFPVNSDQFPVNSEQ